MSDINQETATTLARASINQLAQAAGDQFEILADSTREIEQGWVFFFNTADFVRTQNPTASLAGNCPILVTREGTIHELPTAVPWEAGVRQIYPGSA